MASPKAQLPSHHRALYLRSKDALPEVETLPVPAPTPGTAVVRVLAANVLPYAAEVYAPALADGADRGYPLALPMVPGSGAVGRVAALGPDAAALTVGDVVLVDVFVRGRDDGGTAFLFGTHGGATEGSRGLMSGEFRDATYAEYAKVPLENLTRLPVEKAGEEVGVEEVKKYAIMSRYLVPLGGLMDLDIKPGETIIIAPATGTFGGAAVKVALGMGARVVAAGRNGDALKKLKAAIGAGEQRLRTVQLTGDVEKDSAALGPASAAIDFSPPAAKDSTHLQSCITALKPHGRLSLMGGVPGNVSIPYLTVMVKSLKILGRFMYDREAPQTLVDMLNAGLVGLDADEPSVFALEDWQGAFKSAREDQGFNRQTLIAP